MTLVFFVCLRDDLILAFLLQQFETGNGWTRTLIDYHLRVLQANRLTKVTEFRDRVGGTSSNRHLLGSIPLNELLKNQNLQDT